MVFLKNREISGIGYLRGIRYLKHHIRYVDDFVLFGNSKRELWHWQQAVTHYLANLRLQTHSNKTQIYQVKRGVPFLGFQMFPYYRYVQKAKVKRYRRYLKKTLGEKQAGKVSPQTLEDRLNAWLGHLQQGQSKRLENQIFNYLRYQHGVNLFRSPRGSWRVLEQQR